MEDIAKCKNPEACFRLSKDCSQEARGLKQNGRGAENGKVDQRSLTGPGKDSGLNSEDTGHFLEDFQTKEEHLLA